MTKHMRRFITTASMAAMVLCADGLALAQASSLLMVMESRLSVLDPVVSTSHQTRNHGYMIYDTLFAYDENQKLQPQMVKDWKVSDDKKTYTFTLRDGLAWHDGGKVTAEDCIASIKRWAQQDRMGRLLVKLISEMRADGETSFSITLSIPTDMLLTAFAKPSGIPLFMMPKRVAESPATTPITDYTGSGPFKFVASEYEPGVRAAYDKFEGYVPRGEPASGLAGGKVAKVDRVERIEMADPLTSVNALLTHEVDYLETVPYDLLPLVESAQDARFETADTTGYQAVYRFNSLHPPFDNKLVRQAAIAAIGQEAPLQAQIGNTNYYRTCGSLFGCGLPYESNVHADLYVKADPGRSKELLAQAGYKGEPVVLLQATDIPMIGAMPIVIAQQLRDGGFTVKVQAMDFMTLLSRRSNKGAASEGGWSLFITTWHNTEIQDPIRSFTVTANGDNAWAGWPNVPAIVEAADEFLVAPDETQRKGLADRIQGLAVDEAIVGTLGSITKPLGYGKNVSGVLHSPVPVFWNIVKQGE